MGDVAGGETERSLDEIEDFQVGAAMRVIAEFAQHQTGIMPDLERAAVVEDQARHAVAGGLDHVALQQHVAVVEGDGNAVANHRNKPIDPGGVPDHLRRRLRRFRGGVLSGMDGTGQRCDNIAAQRGAIRRHQRGWVFRIEIARNDMNLAVGPDQPRSSPARLNSAWNSRCASRTVVPGRCKSAVKPSPGVPDEKCAVPDPHFAHPAT